jgi:RNA polymerase sigma-70 factor (ECF subfamily)
MNIYELGQGTGEEHPATVALGDDLLLSMAQAGQQWAFEELCRRHSNRTCQMIYRVTRNCEDAEDALQDSIMSAFRKLGQFDGHSTFATWFTRIGINSALMILRKKRIRQKTSMDTFGDALPPLVHQSPNPEQSYVSNERSMRLERAVSGLSQTLRSVIELRQVEGRSLKEIARSIGISLPAAKSRLSRAKAELRRSMQ